MSLDPDNTRTPFLAWGRAIRGPVTDSKPSSHNSYSKRWGMPTNYRCDIEQADIAPMVSTLLGLDWPINSVGVFPDVDPRKPSFLSPRAGAEKLSNASLTNAKVRIQCYNLQYHDENFESLDAFGALSSQTW